MLSAPMPLRTAISALAVLGVLGALTACSSSSDEAAVPAGHGAEAEAEYSKPPVPTDPDAAPTSEADGAAIAAVINEFYETSNAEDADGFLATLCETVLPQYAGIKNGTPVSDPIVVADVADIAVNADTASANVTIAMGKGSAAQSQSVPYKFTRSTDGQWKVCGSPE